jgi:carboxymethylenebutenolidase
MVDVLEINTSDGVAEAYLAGSGPGVLLYVDAIGLRPRIAEMVDRIGSWGYTVLAPNVFYRSGSAADLAPTTDLRVPENRAAFFASGVMGRVNGLTPDKAERDAAAWLGALVERADAGPLATVGYCMGARLALRTAGWHPDLVAAVGGFHGGGLVTDAPDSPHLAIGRSTAAYLLLHADKDRSLTPAHVEVLEQALVAAGLPHVNEIVAGAPHGYTMSDTSTWDAAGEQRHWVELRRLLDGALGSSS